MRLSTSRYILKANQQVSILQTGLIALFVFFNSGMVAQNHIDAKIQTG